MAAPPARPQDEEDCTAFHNLVDLERKALGAAQVMQSQAWRDTKEKWEKVYIEPSRASIRLERLLNCGCPVITSFTFLEKYWKIRNDPDGPVPGHPTLRNRDAYVGNPDDLLKYARDEVGAVEDCFKKACGEPGTPSPIVLPGHVEKTQPTDKIPPHTGPTPPPRDAPRSPAAGGWNRDPRPLPTASNTSASGWNATSTDAGRCGDGPDCH